MTEPLFKDIDIAIDLGAMTVTLLGDGGTEIAVLDLPSFLTFARMVRAMEGELSKRQAANLATLRRILEERRDEVTSLLNEKFMPPHLRKQGYSFRWGVH